MFVAIPFSRSASAAAVSSLILFRSDSEGGLGSGGGVGLLPWATKELVPGWAGVGLPIFLATIVSYCTAALGLKNEGRTHFFSIPPVGQTNFLEEFRFQTPPLGLTQNLKHTIFGGPWDSVLPGAGDTWNCLHKPACTFAHNFACLNLPFCYRIWRAVTGQ